MLSISVWNTHGVVDKRSIDRIMNIYDFYNDKTYRVRIKEHLNEELLRKTC